MSFQDLEISKTTSRISQDFTQIPNYKSFKDLEWKPIEAAIKELDASIQGYQKDPAGSLKERVKVYKNLSDAVKVIANHINSSKSLFQRFISFFVYLSEEERRFGVFAKKVDGLKHVSQREHDKVWFLNKTLSYPILKFIKVLIKSADYQVKYCAFRLVGNHETYSQFVHGDTPFLSISSLLGDIQAFKNDYAAQLKAEDSIELEEHLKQIEKLRKQTVRFMALVLNHAKIPFLNDKTVLQKGMVDHARMFIREIKNLNVGEKTPMYGGYSSKGVGHAVIYEIIRVTKDQYRFIVHNTGEGALHYQGLLQSMYTPNQARSIFYDNLSLETITNVDLFTNLFQILHSETTQSTSTPSMKDVHKILNQYLKTVPTNGPLHHLQTNGTCALDSLICWQSQTLNPALFELFYLYMKKQAMKKLEKLDDQIFLKDRNEQMSKMPDWATSGIFTESIRNSFLTKVKLKTWGNESLKEHLELFNPPKKQEWSIFSGIAATAERAKRYVIKDLINLESDSQKPSESDCRYYYSLAKRISET